MKTWREKFFNLYKLEEQPLSVEDISKITNLPLDILQDVYNRGYGASKTNKESVRNEETGRKRKEGYSKYKRMSSEKWAYGRLYGFIMDNPKQTGKNKPDYDLKLKLLEKLK